MKCTIVGERREFVVGLDDALLREAAGELGERDARLRGILARHGFPPLWACEPGFPTLVHIILEQQVSLASARAAFTRLQQVASPLAPERFLELDDATLKAAGFSRQKTRYARELARAVVSGSLDLVRLPQLDDDAVRAELTAVKGIGRWTADIYLLMALGRPDVWPSGDLALAAAARRALDLPSLPSGAELHAQAEAWRPWRSVAARILWHAYLSERAVQRSWNTRRGAASRARRPRGACEHARACVKRGPRTPEPRSTQDRGIFWPQGVHYNLRSSAVAPYSFRKKSSMSQYDAFWQAAYRSHPCLHAAGPRGRHADLLDVNGVRAHGARAKWSGSVEIRHGKVVLGSNTPLPFARG